MSDFFTIATWNVNSLRAREAVVLRWLERHRVDVLLMQELKAVQEQISFLPFEDLGYNVAMFGQKSWNGVAILSRRPLEDIRLGLMEEEGEEARYIEGCLPFGGGMMRVASIYVPNGNPMEDEAKFEKKRLFMARLKQRWQELRPLEEICILGGDYNILDDVRDCHNELAAWREDALGCVDAQRWYRALLHEGLSDGFRLFEDGGGAYSYWDYQGGAFGKDAGLLIDRLLLSPQAADVTARVFIDREPRGWEKASDHTPLCASLREP